MTLKPEQIGDKGQRYEVQVTGYPKDKLNVVGWTNDKESAYELARGFGQAPGAVSARIVDRQGIDRDHVIYFGFFK